MKLQKMAALARAGGQNKIEDVETIFKDSLAIDECDFIALKNTRRRLLAE